MSTPYRDAPEAVDVEPLPAFRPVERTGLWISIYTAFILCAALTDWFSGRRESAVMIVALRLPAIAVAWLCCALEPRVRAWFDRRYARKVARGIAELEARAAR